LGIKTEAFYGLKTARLLVLEARPLIQGPVLVHVEQVLQEPVVLCHGSEQ